MMGSLTEPKILWAFSSSPKELTTQLQKLCCTLLILFGYFVNKHCSVKDVLHVARSVFTRYGHRTL